MHKSLARNVQKGFTLIELIVVIVILGILAATAVPRFFTAASSARAASMSGLAGAMNSAISITHAQYLVLGGTPATVTMDGGTVVNMVNGYPDASANGIGAAIIGATTATSYTPTYTGLTASTWSPAGATTPAGCIFTYTAATVAAGVVTAAFTGPLTTTGC